MTDTSTSAINGAWMAEDENRLRTIALALRAECDRLAAERDAAIALAEKGAEDTRRLDWLARRDGAIRNMAGFLVADWFMDTAACDPRAAIDAAIAKEAQTK